jgi:hypothetical protein
LTNYVIFGLVRGYKGREKWKYAQLIRRNRALLEYKKQNSFSGDFLLFHEGNIGLVDALGIQILSGLRIKFVNVAKDFCLEPDQIWSGQSGFPLGYSLMCRFNYQRIWDYLGDYQVGCRVDEDVVVSTLPSFDSVGLFKTGALADETHPETNKHLGGWLHERGLGWAYDHKFPYTNLYVTDLAFWRRANVQAFLSQVASNPNSVEYRWGDLPVIGVALKVFGSWDAEQGVSNEIKYFHASHTSMVENGQITDLDPR